MMNLEATDCLPAVGPAWGEAMAAEYARREAWHEDDDAAMFAHHVTPGGAR